MSTVKSVTIHLADGRNQVVAGDDVASRASAALDLYAKRDEAKEELPEWKRCHAIDHDGLRCVHAREHDSPHRIVHPPDFPGTDWRCPGSAIEWGNGTDVHAPAKHKLPFPNEIERGVDIRDIDTPNDPRWAEPMANERAAIVAWLRKQAGIEREDVRHNAIVTVAEDIEYGEHRK